jgi:uncharacterized protein
VDLQHRFTVPTSVEETWAHFNDLAAVAECFPGATVTTVESDSLAGSVKVRLGPIALVYAGSGRFVEKDEEAHRFVVEAKGKDKRGNGTAGVTVTLAMASAAGGTDVEVLTDLAITGKPAQFGRGVMQDVSDKLLGQFVACLEQRLSGSGGGEAATEPTPATVADPLPGPAGGEQATDPPPPTVAGSPPPRPARPTPAHAAADSVDLGAAVVPVLLRSYGPVLAAAAAGLAVGWLLGRRR